MTNSSREERLDDTSYTVYRLTRTNREKVYRAILLYPNATFIDLKRITGLKPDKLSDVLAKLYDDGLICPVKETD